MAEMQATKLNKSQGANMLKAMQMALKPSEKLLEKQKVLLTHLTRNSYKTAEEKLESRKAEQLKNEEEKKQTGFLAQLLGQSDKKGKSGGIWGFLKDNWGKIAIGIGLLLTPIKHLVAGFEWMKDYWEDHTLAEMGADLATAFVVAMGLKIGAGILFKELSGVILKSLLPAGVKIAGLTAGALGRALLSEMPIVAFVAGIGKSIWDGVEGWNFAKEWGVEGIDGAIGGFIGGTGKGLTGALTNALTKGGIGIGVGFAVGGPIGAIVGGVIGAAFGAITGWFGGERIAKWVNESRKEISKAWDNTTSILNDVMDKFKNWGNGIADDIISLVRKIPGFKDFGQTSEEKRRAAVGYDEAHLSTEEQNALQKNKHQQQDKALRGGAASAVAKGNITGIEKEIEAVGIEYSNLMSRGKDQPGFAQEKSRLGKRMAKLRQDKIAIQKNKKATKIGGTSKSALQQLKEDEGFRSKVYDDTEGIKTIGYGFNLERAGTQEALDAAGIKKSVADLKSGKVNLTEQEAERLMMGEYPYFRQAAKRYLGEDKWPPFPEPKKDALTNMAYNLGEKKLNTFTNLREALRNEDYELAGQEVLRSKYATQVGARAQRISGALSATVSPMEKSNAFNAQQNMNNELKMNQAGGNTIMIDKSTKQVNNSNSGSPMIKGLETDVVGKDITGKTR